MIKKCDNCGKRRRVFYLSEFDESLCIKCAKKRIEDCRQESQDLLYEAEALEKAICKKQK